MGEIETFIDGYRDAFVRGDVDALLERFAFPVQTLSVIDGAATIGASDREAWRGVIGYIVGAYGTLGVAAATSEVEVAEPLAGIRTARVHWRLRRADGEPVYDFTAVYTLASVDGVLLIVSVAHDELPRLGAALQAAEG